MPGEFAQKIIAFLEKEMVFAKDPLVTSEEESSRPVIANTRRSLVARLCDSINPFKKNDSNQNR
jgi:hypothetical protein